jgi:hypothetical protein
VGEGVEDVGFLGHVGWGLVGLVLKYKSNH